MLNYLGETVSICNVRILKTPQRVGLYGVINSKCIELWDISCDGQAKVKNRRYDCNGILVSGDVENLPPENPGKFIIVSPTVAFLCNDRHDLLVPLDPVYDEKGRHIGNRRIGKFPEDSVIYCAKYDTRA